MKDAQKTDHVSLNIVISRLSEGRYVIPDFQRDFEWEPWDISALMRSIFLDYYIGTLLFWKGKRENYDALACEPIHGFSEANGSPEHIVLDGQQRLTAIYYAFKAPNVALPKRANRYLYFIRLEQFMAEAYDSAFEYTWNKQGLTLLNNRQDQFKAHMFPLSIVGQGGFELYRWVTDYQAYWKDVAQRSTGDARTQAGIHAANGAEFGQYVKDITENYQIAFIELDRDMAVDKVCDIFTQINSRGIRLDVFDLINALLKPKGLQLKHLWRKAKPRLDFIDSPRLNVYILQVMSIMLQNYCSPKYLYYLLPGQEKTVRGASDGGRRTEILIATIEEFEARWDTAVRAMERAINLLKHPQEFGALASKFLPYQSILPVFSALQCYADALIPMEQLEANRKIRLWYWASVFTNRYSGSVESTSARDYLDVKEWIKDGALEPGLITEFKNRVNNLDLRREVKQGTSVYNAVFDLLILQGAPDWITGNAPQYDNLDDHHIVPQAWGKTNLKNDTIHTILNRTALTPLTNQGVIQDRLPNEYLPELIKQNGSERVRNILELHGISAKAQMILCRKPFSSDDFEEFIVERQRTLRLAIEDLLVKERIQLPPDLRLFDARIENVELALRRAVDKGLGGMLGQLPPHVDQKIEDRLQRAYNKNVMLDRELYSTLAGRLEFCDLRELQDTIINKSLWQTFSQTFGNRETLVGKFNQLAELRNGIRHSRTVNDVTYKEGEAAILWFEQTLNLIPHSD